VKIHHIFQIIERFFKCFGGVSVPCGGTVSAALLNDGYAVAERSLLRVILLIILSRMLTYFYSHFLFGLHQNTWRLFCTLMAIIGPLAF